MLRPIYSPCFILNIIQILFNGTFNFSICKQIIKISEGAKIRNRYNQVPHLTQYTNGKVTNSQLPTTSESQEVSPFSAGDHKAHINRRTQRHSKHKTEQNIKHPQKKYRFGTVSKLFTGGLKPVKYMCIFCLLLYLYFNDSQMSLYS